MPDVPERPEPEVQDTFAEGLVKLRNRLEDKARVAMTGEPEGTVTSVRRPMLFIVAMIGTGFAPAFGTLPAVVALVAILLLAYTDKVVDL